MKKVKISDIYENPRLAEMRIAENDKCFKEIFGETDNIQHFSAPGRTEICGNHTDHNNGKVLAAAINLDILASVKKTCSNSIHIKSNGFEMNIVDIDNLEIHDNETSHSSSLIRGVCRAFVDRGYKIGGFDAYTVSDVLKGSGLSSSAAFEVLVATILNHLYNDAKINPVEIAEISRFAENKYFGKPSGLMDQMASSVGGFVYIDFESDNEPKIESIDFDFNSTGYNICIVDTKADHADLTNEYASIKNDMADVAKYFSCRTLREVSKEAFFDNISDVRKSTNDRAIIRAIHYFNENINVDIAKKALIENDFNSFKNTIINSGKSSAVNLQNIYSVSSPENQAVSVVLAVTEELLKDNGAYRIHGGGFGGTILTFVPNQLLDTYKENIEKLLGEGSCYILNIRKYGGVEII